MGIMEESKLLASLAVFRQLYDHKKDIYGVISEFLDSVIENNGLHQFNSNEITGLLNKNFEFTIPEAVIKTALNRLKYLTKHNGYFHVDLTIKKNKSTISMIQNEEIQSNNIIIDELLKYIVLNKKISLTNEQKENIIHSFCSFLLDESSGNEYSEYISGFIIDNSNLEFREKLKQIREGVLLYSGLKYNNLSESGSWNTNLTIYVDTEVLFHLSGYNGELFKTQFDDFHTYVKEINAKAKKKIIELVYFKEVREELEGFFRVAEFIVEGKTTPDPSKTAMNSIIQGCKSPSDVVAKKADFDLNLSSLGIFEAKSVDYSEENNFEYNIIDSETMTLLSREYGSNISGNVNFLNAINIFRAKAADNNFENIRYILLTGKSLTTRIAWDNRIKKEGKVPLATTLEWLTNKFWFKLNKGFGNDDLPSSVDIITKSQIMLSSVLNHSVSDKYDELLTLFKKGEISEEVAKAIIIDLRSNVRKPEEIEKDDVALILNVIREDTLEQFVNEQTIKERQAEENIKENKLLRKELLQAKINNKQIEISNKETQIEQISEKIKITDRKVGFEVCLLKGFISVLFILFYILVLSYDWSTLEKWTYILASLPITVSFIYYFILEKTNKMEVLLNQWRERYRKKVLLKYNVDLQEYERIKDKVAALIIEVENLNRELIHIN